MTTRWLRRAAIVAGLLAFSTTGAQALQLDNVAGGLEADDANYGCPTAPGICSLAARDYTLAADATAMGGVAVTPAGVIALVDILQIVDVASFTGTGAPMTFSQVFYGATLYVPSTAITPIGPGTGGISAGFGTGYVSGNLNGSPFLVTANVSISCNYPGGIGQCGITYGEEGFTDVLGYDWRHTFNVTVQQQTPEPSTAVLLGLGLAGLALRARSR